MGSRLIFPPILAWFAVIGAATYVLAHVQCMCPVQLVRIYAAVMGMAEWNEPDLVETATGAHVL